MWIFAQTGRTDWSSTGVPRCDPAILARQQTGATMHEVTSKTIDGITDLVVIAPIKEGFIQAYENITYASRLKLVAEGLNRIRVAAREFERVVPFSDVTERILNLLDFRVGVLDKDLFGLARKGIGELVTLQQSAAK